MRDLALLTCELIACLRAPLAHLLSSRRELDPRALGERFNTHRSEPLVCHAELSPRVDPSILTSEPLPVQQLSSGCGDADTGPLEPFDRLAIECVGDLALADQR